MMEQVLNYVKSEHMLSPGDQVIVGFSGGADSVCLLFVLHEISKTMPIHLRAIHVNHEIRKEEAQRDASFCEEFCKEYGIEFFLVKENVKELAKKLKISTEEAGRKVRYDAFLKHQRILLEKNPMGSVKIAVAHHQNDQAETVLFRLVRGSGLQGLCGMSPVNGNIIRPLLKISKEEIQQYLAGQNLHYVEDSSNQENDYTRNKIRNQILPLLEQEVCSQAVEHIADAAEIIAETHQYVNDMALEAAKNCVFFDSSGVQIKTSNFLKHSTILQKYILLDVLGRISHGRKDIGQVHIKSLLELFSKQSGKEINLPYGLHAKMEYDVMQIQYLEEPSTEEAINLSLFKENEQTYVLPDGRRLYIKSFPYLENQIIPENTYTKWFDYDKILGVLMIRNPMEGDYFVFHKNQSRKLLKEYFKQEKIPAKERKKMFVIGEEHHILWVPGYRISQHYKVDSTTKKIMQMQIVEGE